MCKKGVSANQCRIETWKLQVKDDTDLSIRMKAKYVDLGTKFRKKMQYQILNNVSLSQKIYQNSEHF